MTNDAFHPDRRQFLASLTLAVAARRLPWSVAANSITIKTLAEYQAEGTAYTTALNALNVNVTSVGAHTTLTARVGGDLTRRMSRIIAEAAQDPRVVAGIKPLVASSTAFTAFSKAVSTDAKAVLSVPGLQAALNDAQAREAALRRTTLAKQSTYLALLRQQAESLKDPARLSEVAAAEKKAAQQQAAAALAASVAVAVAVVVVAVAVAAATFSVGAAAPVAAAGAAVGAGVVAVTAGAVAAFTQGAAQAAEAAGNAVQDCLDAAWSRRQKCRGKITTPFPAQREYEQGLCEFTYLGDVLSCAG